MVVGAIALSSSTMQNKSFSYKTAPEISKIHKDSIYEISRHFSSRVADKLPIAPWAGNEVVQSFTNLKTKRR